MSELADQARHRARDAARRTRDTWRARPHSSDVQARLLALEEEVQEARQLQRRVAELTDVVTELLIPLQQRDPAYVDAVLEKYRSRL